MDLTSSKMIKVNFGDDIRRFSVPFNTTFNDFTKTLEYLYGVLNTTHMLKYVDDEMDLISITTTKELEEAFKFNKDATLKLQIIPLKIEDKILEQEEDIIENSDINQDVFVDHEAYCDHCDADIYGVRYKCSNCSNFDLCETCETLWNSDFSIHDVSHVFLKIYTPLPELYTCSRLVKHNLYDIEAKDNNNEKNQVEVDKEDEEEKKEGEEKDVVTDASAIIAGVLADMEKAHKKLSQQIEAVRDNNDEDSDEDSSSSDENSDEESSSSEEEESSSEEEEEESSSSEEDSDDDFQPLPVKEKIVLVNKKEEEKVIQIEEKEIQIVNIEESQVSDVKENEKETETDNEIIIEEKPLLSESGFIVFFEKFIK